jgi:nickel/cobalt exporter
MPPIADLIQQGSTNLWLFIPTAILLGALHGLSQATQKP